MDPRNWLIYGLLAALAAVGFVAFSKMLEVATLEREIAQEREMHANERLAQANAQRTRETRLRKEIDTLKENTDAKLRRMARDHAVYVDELRQRASRRSVQMPAGVPGADDALRSGTGAGLFSEDAIFLAGEAALSGERRELLIECRAALEKVRSAYAPQDP